MKIAVLTVFYPGMEQFVEEYQQCIVNQSLAEFDMIIVNDNFPGSNNRIENFGGKKTRIIQSNGSPQQNRMAGFTFCYQENYDLVICSDSDETMDERRVELVAKYFQDNPQRKIVYNNSVYREGHFYFDLYFKPEIKLQDILDFNVLGYGALNVKRSLIPFVLSRANENVMIFDWWLGLHYLMENPSVNFLKEAFNEYRLHEQNFVGPVIKVNEEAIRFSIRIKKNLYEEMIAYCTESKLNEYKKLFERKRSEMMEIDQFIQVESMNEYLERVHAYFQGRKKIYWWEPAVTLAKLGINTP